MAEDMGPEPRGLTREESDGSMQAINMLEMYARSSVESSSSKISLESQTNEAGVARGTSSNNTDDIMNTMQGGFSRPQSARLKATPSTFLLGRTGSVSDSSVGTDTDEVNLKPINISVEDQISTLNQAEKVGKDDFDILRVLGSGAFAKVFLVKKVRGKQAGKVFAMKVLGKARIVKDPRMITHTKAERHILEEVNHPFIVNLCYAFQTDGKLYLILEFKNGGELFTHLMKQGVFTEGEVKVYAAELVLALSHLHSLGIIYRDLKLENILLDSQGHIALTDFGLSKESMHDPLERTKSFAGTVEYMAPEMVKGKGYCRTVDWWALGVLIFELITGVPSFNNPDGKDNSHSDIMDRIKYNHIEYPDFFSDDLCDFLSGMICKRMSKRLGAADVVPTDIFEHPWFSEFDWDDVLAKKLKVPFIPAVESDGDTGQFDTYFTNQKPIDSPALPMSTKEELFRGFSFVSPAAHRQLTMIHSQHEALKQASNRLGMRISADFSPRFVSPLSGGGVPAVIAESTRTEDGFRIPGTLRRLSSRSVTVSESSAFSKKYQITNESLGRGSFSVCYKCLERSSGKFYAVKIISKASRVGSPVAVEIENLRKCLGFKHVVQLHETLDDDEYDYMVMELLKGGELFDRIKSKTKFTELAAAEVMAKIVEAVKSIHAIHIAHRDIKPENLLYDSESDSSELKLIDFGFSKSVEDGSLPLKTPCFTAAYAAPEVLKNDGEYDMSCDLWSVGVIMYTLLCGYPPFNVRKKSDSALYDTIVSNGEFKFKDEDWRDVSSAARDLIQRFLDVVPSRRISAKEALAHPWFNEIRARSNKRKLMALPSSNFLDAASVTDNIEAYRKIIPKLQMSGVKDSAIAKRRKLKHLSESGESGTEGNTPTKLDTKPQ